MVAQLFERKILTINFTTHQENLAYIWMAWETVWLPHSFVGRAWHDIHIYIVVYQWKNLHMQCTQSQCQQLMNFGTIIVKWTCPHYLTIYTTLTLFYYSWWKIVTWRSRIKLSLIICCCIFICVLILHGHRSQVVFYSSVGCSLVGFNQTSNLCSAS